jgi:alpha-tubulin suppressor-like RCC1 family protein
VALKRDGTVWTWGSGLLGELGIGSTPGTQVTPVQVQGIPSIYAIRQGWSHVVAIGRDSSVWFWGRGGTETAYLLPTQVAALQGSALREFAVGSNSYNIYALAADGAVYSWGFDSHGQLGNGHTNNRFSPTPMPGVSGITAVAAGAYYDLLLKADGSLWGVGDNEFGQLGDGTTVARPSIVRVQNLANVAAAAAGYVHSVAVTRDGSVWTWGYNQHNALGDGTQTSRSAPGRVFGIPVLRKNSIPLDLSW